MNYSFNLKIKEKNGLGRWAPTSLGISLLAHFFCWVLVQDAIIELGSLLALVMMGSQITELGPDLTDKRKKKKTMWNYDNERQT